MKKFCWVYRGLRSIKKAKLNCFCHSEKNQMAEITRKVLHLFADADENGEVKILLPSARTYISVAVSYVHVEFAKRSSKDYIKICADFINFYDNHERIICAFRQPQNMRDHIYEPQFKERYDVCSSLYSDKHIKVISKNQIQKVYIRLEVEVF